MPIYEYKCKNCEARIEKMQKVGDAPLAVCENCGGEMEKQWSLSGFQFKGAGWYVTDYSEKGKDKGTPDKGKTEPVTEKKSEVKSDASTSSEKSSSGESTVAPQTASNTTKSDVSTSKKE